MSYTDDAVKAKLSALNDTQEAIVTVSQWVMFHRRYADRTAQIWLEKMKDSHASKRLNLVYLANEVCQQSKARKKEDFIRAFSPIIAEGIAAAYKGASMDVQQKIRRVIEVLRSRHIFDFSVQQNIEARLDEIDRSRSTGKKAALGGSLFAASASSVPPDFQPAVNAHASLTKAEVLAKPAVTNAQSEYMRQMDPNAPVPTPPVHAARLSALIKTLANAEGAVAESIKARRALLDGLERLVHQQKESLQRDEAKAAEIAVQATNAEEKRREIENSIMRGLSAEHPGLEEPERPDTEPLTPPPVESLTPVGTPKGFVTTTGADVVQEQPNTFFEPAPPPYNELPDSFVPGIGAYVSNGGVGQGRHLSPESNGASVEPEGKRRKIHSANTDELDAFADDTSMGEIDADVEEMLGK
ncbi:hypothetical protein EJ06DRAFT_532396 [Trichodelitschia bisporula]|uniref:CID domain-containing protein n=1 Tax=Trichodelitschia bisporula TaxID=703511 RepID=A0A6G1HPT9_9PEZI|nr:hypothetical protein EJ06DRAFT_532396 [Trichodelitschia bisporula]